MKGLIPAGLTWKPVLQQGMKKQIKEMMSIQNELNCQLNPDWKKDSWDFSLASDVEMVEAIEHYGWRWWKH